KILLVYARGGAYGAETGSQALDLQRQYMETILKFIGFQNFDSIVIEPTLAGSPQEKENRLNRAKEQAKVDAAKF
ncbi:MAG TPA: NAD(P)H-dependent oxidoreductase, partial [Chlamydiales bacterium]|nr:NAD(P)H-dependent oxidoreductase [Chlamydiales bacterium]